MLAGMNGKFESDAFAVNTLIPADLVAAGPELAAAVTNAGGLGVIGGVGYVCLKMSRQSFLLC
jgi:hypothetical protein